VTLNVVNTGSPDHEATVRANVPAGAGALVVGGTTYNLLQFHFHIPGEHLLNGHEFDMELHLVHQDPASGGLLVVGRWIEVGSPSPLLDPIFSDLPPSPASPRTVTGFDLGGLLPSTLTSFRYPGSRPSLTTKAFSGSCCKRLSPCPRRRSGPSGVSFPWATRARCKTSQAA
jgi:carbonic anhydrase